MNAEKQIAKPGVVCYSDGVACPGCAHYRDPVKNPECSYKADATRRTIDDASNEEWLHAAARIAGGNHVEDSDDEFSDAAIMGGPIRGEKESALCAVWLGYQTELISEQEVIRQSVALATAADLEIRAMRKEIESLRLGVDILGLDYSKCHLIRAAIDAARDRKESPMTDLITPRLMWCCYEINGTMHFFEENYLTLGCGVLHGPHRCSIEANGVPVACIPIKNLKDIQLAAYQAWWRARERGKNAKEQINAALASAGIKSPAKYRRS